MLLYDPRRANIGLWDSSRLKLDEVRPNRLEADALVDANRTKVRRIIENPRS